MLKIAILGPECSGKTVLSEALAAHYDEPWVAEFARKYLGSLGRKYNEMDLLNIARGQLLEEAMAEKRAAQMMFCDTEMITIYIWSKEKFGRVGSLLEETVHGAEYDLYLLCKPEMAWEPDPLREDPHDRDRLFEVYKRTLDQFNDPYHIVQGDHEQRVTRSTDWVNELVKVGTKR